MPESYMPSDRASLLADVAEMYYLEEKGQAEIARVIGMTRSMVSRLLTEAREKGIVEVQIHRVLSFDHELETALIKQFDLKSAQVVVVGNGPNEQILNYLGSAGAQLLKRCLTAGTHLRPILGNLGKCNSGCTDCQGTREVQDHPTGGCARSAQCRVRRPCLGPTARGKTGRRRLLSECPVPVF